MYQPWPRVKVTSFLPTTSTGRSWKVGWRTSSMCIDTQEHCLGGEGRRGVLRGSLPTMLENLCCRSRAQSTRVPVEWNPSLLNLPAQHTSGSTKEERAVQSLSCLVHCDGDSDLSLGRWRQRGPRVWLSPRHCHRTGSDVSKPGPQRVQRGALLPKADAGSYTAVLQESGAWEVCV